jgi:hypothetical protein
MSARLLSALVAVLMLSGCRLLGDLPRIGEPRVTAHLEVFNRTRQDIFYVDTDGRRLDVPACGQAQHPSFRIDNVRVRTEAGYIRGFGNGDSSLEWQRVYVIEVSSAMDSGGPTLGSPDALPPCDGNPEVQVGV